ncbi:MAG: transposase [Oligoflexia bacterium]|nr:transposase [Oligoflexia bacterium]
MGRSLLIRTNDFPYHVRIRSNNREWFYLPIEEVWEIFTFQLQETATKHNLDIYCFTLMNNHYHLLFKTPDQNIDKALQHLNHQISLAIGKKANRINRIFGTRYKWSIVQTENYLLRVYRYIYQNPIRAGICEKVEVYPYNSLNSSLKSKNIIDNLDKIGAVFDKNNLTLLNWLNEKQGEDHYKQTKKGLQKKFFDPVFKRKY